MSLLLESTIPMSVVILLALGAITVMRRQSAALRHWVLAVGIGCAAATPVFALVAPAWHLPWNVPPAARLPAVAPAIVAVQVDDPAASGVTREAPSQPGIVAGDAPAGWRLLASVWLAGVAMSVLTLLAGFVRLATITSRARRATRVWSQHTEEISRAYGLRRPVAVLETHDPTLLVTCGVLRPRIIVPPTARHWSPDRVRSVLAHELAHLRRGDWVVQIASELVRAIYWFNPLLWIACRRLRQESEYACDDAVLTLGIDRTDYATHLVDLARAFSKHGRTWLPAPAMARPSTLQRRIRAMLNVGLNRRPLTRSARAAVVIALLALTVPIAGLGGQVFASVSGAITDSTGGIIPDATVTLSNVETKAKYEVRSDATGAFQVGGLPAGDYWLETRFMGFAPHREALTLTAGQTLRSQVTLQVGSLQETVTVGRSSEPGATGRPTSRSKPATTPACEPSPVGGRIVPPTKVRHVAPVYPASLDNATDTSIILEARIGTDGFVNEVRTPSAVDPDVERAAIDAVSQWQFTPTLLNCVPVEVKMTVSVTFKPAL